MRPIKIEFTYVQNSALGEVYFAVQFTGKSKTVQLKLSPFLSSLQRNRKTNIQTNTLNIILSSALSCYDKKKIEFHVCKKKIENFVSTNFSFL